MEPDKIDDMIKKYIYESPDGGNTVTKREFGSNKKEYVKSLADKKEIEKLAEEFEEITGSDVGYDMSRDWLDHGTNVTTNHGKTYTIDTSTLATSGTTLTTSASPSYSFDTSDDFDVSSIYRDVNEDITLSVDGKERKISELFKTVDVIKKRMAILEPKKEMLEKYKVLQDLYDQYKAAEALLDGPDVEDNDEND